MYESLLENMDLDLNVLDDPEKLRIMMFKTVEQVARSDRGKYFLISNSGVHTL